MREGNSLSVKWKHSVNNSVKFVMSQGRVLVAVGSTLRLYELHSTQNFDGTGREYIRC